jgi:hypothetical protein
MQQRMIRVRVLWAVLGGVALTLPAVTAGGELYAWRTDDGVYAYTDDPKAVPARYADEVEVVRNAGLSGYERFTRQDGAAANRYADRMAKRLDYLRQVNASSAPAPRGYAPARAPASTTISVATGNEQAPRLDITTPTGVGQAPLVLESVASKPDGAIRTRRTTLVRQGGETIAVLKGRKRETNPSTDFLDEDDLEQGRY